jgi:hypothetical protein
MSGVRYPARAILRAREHRLAGWSLSDVRRLIGEEFGSAPNRQTVKGWLDPQYATRRRRQQRSGERRRRGVKPNRRLSADWKAEQIVRLHEAGCSVRSITVVAAVLWGDELTEHQVRGRLEGRAEYRKAERAA